MLPWLTFVVRFAYSNSWRDSPEALVSQSVPAVMPPPHTFLLRTTPPPVGAESMLSGDDLPVSMSQKEACGGRLPSASESTTIARRLLNVSICWMTSVSLSNRRSSAPERSSSVMWSSGPPIKTRLPSSAKATANVSKRSPRYSRTVQLQP